jgi:hypothetical protein
MLESGKSTYWANGVVGSVLGGRPFTPPPVVYLALFLAPLSPGGGVPEVSGGSYARVRVANNRTSWSAPNGGSVVNLVTFNFPDTTADWGVVVSFAIMDSATGGNMLYFAQLSTPRNLLKGSKSRFSPGALVVVES